MPNQFSRGSKKQVGWICHNGHKWKASIKNRCINGANCPYCSRKKAIPGETDLATTHPQLVEEWDFEANGDLRPSHVSSGSNKKVWWKCAFNHHWEATVNNRANHGTICPYCSGKKVIPGKTDLSTTHPHIASEWDYEANGDLTPNQVTFMSKSSVNWKCIHGHKWHTAIRNRTIKNNNCPFCSGYRVIIGENDLATTHPHLVKEWDDDANGELHPNQVTSKCKNAVFWKCSCGHSWKSSVVNRAHRNNRCPVCSKRAVIAGVNDLATTDPHIAAEWDYESNEGLMPTQVKRGTRKQVWWKCQNGHKWKADISNRALLNTGCPYCSGNQVLSGVNDLATTHPHLVKEWDFDANGELSPTQVSGGSKRKVGWICSKGHKWEASITNRTRNNTGCPYCSGRRAIPGETDLTTTHPLLALEWDYDSNAELLPNQFVKSSKRSVWWKCGKGHKWKARIQSRAMKLSHCPVCSGVKKEGCL